uniref:cytochrome b n=1 Tax=Lebertia trifurcilla TaxID=450597 RepID=UPI0021153FC4|nr:cytochrome b [Lebertia trifurcilla]UTE89516.1 cytochrome b [Lebertia trifurcilla]
MKKKHSSISPITKIVKNSILNLPTPSNISYMWNFGSLLGINLMIQIVSGILLSMHYAPETSMAFESTIHITRDINSGWFMRMMHMNGASLFFILIYSHISRGLLFSSFKKKETWISGVFIILMLMGTAFMGYVLPWGQMSFWGATVITNLLSAIPFFGTEIVQWIWGGFSVSNATLNRFFSIHFLLPFILSALILIHIMTLHESGSSNPTGTLSDNDKLMFHPFFSWKDLTPPIFLIYLLTMMILLEPNLMGDPENYNPANPMMTPIHIQPEWYFLFAYAILRSIPNKLGGVIALIMSILIIFLNTMTKIKWSSCKFNPMKKTVFWVIASSFMILTWGGAKQIESPFEEISKMTSMMYFYFMMII